MVNPPWNNDELILALDLYFSLSYGQMDGKHPRVKALGELLSLMNEEKGFSRTTASVSLKLANFKRVDPDFTGKGMEGGGKAEESLWEQFAGNKPLLSTMAAKIKDDIITGRKTYFREWLKKNGKPDGSPYQQSTILTYVAQVESSIFKEFSVYPEGVSLYEITDPEELAGIEKLLHQGTDSKKRRDLRSAYQAYVRFIKERYTTDIIIPEYEGESRTEGGRRVFVSQRAERDVRLRNRAIELHGTSCQACGFNFGHTYGSWGEGFAEVHHLLPLGNKDTGERETDPQKDLIVLCANCHRMAHRKRGITLTVEELKEKINPAARYEQ